MIRPDMLREGADVSELIRQLSPAEREKVSGIVIGLNLAREMNSVVVAHSERDYPDSV